MNGIHDVGGMHGLGPIPIDSGDVVFSTEWERRTFGVVLAYFTGALCPPDEFRHAIEIMKGADYLTTSYYEHWLHAAEVLALRHGLVTGEELAGLAQGARIGGEGVMRKVQAAEVMELVHTPGDFRREVVDAPRFSPGDRIVTKNINPIGHTRLPRYARGRVGTVQTRRGAYVFPDTSAHGLGENPQHVYCVKFEASDLWGPGEGGRNVLHLDLWEHYIVGRAGAEPNG